MHTISEPYPLTIDRTRTLEQLIAAGHYDWVNPNIILEFSLVSGTTVLQAEAFLVDFNRSISSNVVLSWLATADLRPGDFTELLAFGAQYPEMQREFPIVELASVWTDRDGHCCVACLYVDADERYLGIRWGELDWHDSYRFLAFRKS